MKIFFDFEFTGLTMKTTPISLGMITEDGHKFYAEFTDYDKDQCDEWINDNVISKLLYNDDILYFENDKDNKKIVIKNDKKSISESVHQWLKQFKDIEFWGDCVAYDWLLMIDLLGMGKPMRKFPNNFTSYQAFDIFTVLKMEYYKPKKNRHEILGIDNNESQHNSLYDAEITMKLYNRFVKKTNDL
jgi:DNA polymerase III epsilon subunit-like protein